MPPALFKSLEISPGIEICGLALWFKTEKALLLSDLHLGYEEELQQRGVLLPKFQAAEMLQQLQQILQQVQPQKIKKIIINGDLKHEFGRVLAQEWRETLRLIDFLQEHCAELILIRGNHDIILGPIAEKRNLQIVTEYLLGDTLILHGDKLPKKSKNNKANKWKRIVIGHEHPALSFREKGKVEKYKCFLKGTWKRKELMVLPSFNPLLEGTEITREKLLSPFLTNLQEFEVFVVEKEEVFNFGKLKNLKN